MSGFHSDLKYGIRVLRNSPGFTAIGVAMLAIGIGANTVIFSGIESFLMRPLPLPEPDRLVFLKQVVKKTGEPLAAAYPDYIEWKATPGVFDSLAGLAIDTFNVAGGGDPLRIRGSRVTADFFSVMGIAPQIGRTFTVSDDEPGAGPTVVLSHGFWLKHFGGSAAALGRGLNIDGKAHTIVGVMPASLRFPMGFCDFWVPLAASAAEHGRGDHFLTVIGRLRAGVEPTDAGARLDPVAERLEQAFPESNRNIGIRLVLLQDQISQAPKRALFVLFGTVTLVLMICCANLANLMLARAVHRAREVAIRLAVGASRWRLIRQLLAESLLLSVAGGCAGLLMAAWGIELLHASLPPPLQPLGGMSLNGPVLAFCVVLSVLTGVLFGLVPGLRMLRADSVECLRSGGHTSASFGRSRTASALVIAEIAVATLLLVGAGLLLDSWTRTRNADLGYDPRPVLTAEIAAKSARYSSPAEQAFAFEQIVGRLQTTPGVKAASAVNWPPMTNNTRKAIAIEGRENPADGRPPVADYRVATARYAEVMGIPMVRGRFISDSDRWTTEPVVVINARLARAHWPNDDAIGKRLAIYTDPGKHGPWLTVVGVVGDIQHSRPGATPVPEVYLPLAQTGAGQLYLAIRTTGDPAAFARTLESAVRSVDPQLPLNLVRPMEQVIADGVAPTRVVTGLLSLFSVLAIVLAAMGLYGVISYLVARRMHEFGIRLALGAGTRDLLQLVLRRSMLLTCIGTALGLLGGLAASRVLGAVFEGVRPEASVFGSVALVLAGTAVGAAWVPLRRALARGPMNALRDQ